MREASIQKLSSVYICIFPDQEKPQKRMQAIKPKELIKARQYESNNITHTLGHWKV